MKRPPAKPTAVALLSLTAVLWLLAVVLPPSRLLPVDSHDPAHPAGGREALPMPDAIAALVARSCMDCHSLTTRWPWYARLPAVNFVLAAHVRDGRDELLLPHWRGSASSGRAAWMNLGASCYDVREGLMPPRGYRTLHPGSRWSAAETDAFCAWAERTRDSLKAAEGQSAE